MSRRAHRRLELVGILLGASLGLPGCLRAPGPDGVITVATPWPEAERRRIERDFGRWLEGQPEASGRRLRVDWLPLAPGDDPARVARPGRRPWDPRPRAPDVLLGGPSSSYRRLAEEGKLLAVDRPGHPAWCECRRSPIGWARARAEDGKAPAVNRPVPAFDDPRHDPISLAWAKAQLGAGTWAEGYAQLVRDAGHSRRIGRQSGAALAAVERGEAASAPATAPSVPGLLRPASFVGVPKAPDCVEGVAVLSGAGHPDLAQTFLRFLADRGEAATPLADRADDPATDSLLADLLGATLVDAQDELWTGWAVLDRAGQPALAGTWMTESPPWPPASVAKLNGRDRSGIMLGTLVEQVAPDADVRAWLLRSWLGPERRIDGRLLTDLGAAAGGRLVREPRFRAWLRAEWTAWARQRYRRVARRTGGSLP